MLPIISAAMISTVFQKMNEDECILATIILDSKFYMSFEIIILSTEKCRDIWTKVLIFFLEDK